MIFMKKMNFMVLLNATIHFILDNYKLFILANRNKSFTYSIKLFIKFILNQKHHIIIPKHLLLLIISQNVKIFFNSLFIFILFNIFFIFIIYINQYLIN